MLIGSESNASENEKSYASETVITGYRAVHYLLVRY